MKPEDKKEYYRVLRLDQVSSGVLERHTNVRVVESSDTRLVLELPTGDLIYVYTDLVGHYVLEFFLEKK